MARRAFLSSTVAGPRILGASVVLALALAPGAATGPPAESTAVQLPGEPMVPGVVLREVRTSSAEPRADTLITVLTAGRMRVTYGDVATILDVAGDRFALVESSSASYRSIPFTAWETEVRRSPAGDGLPDTLRFESMGGDAVPIAGVGCSRHHLYARREVFPGEFETVEQEIWMTRELALPSGALETSRRVQQALDWIGLGALVARPDGIALRTTIRRRPEGMGPEADEFEAVETIAVELRDVPVAWFEIPAGYTKAHADGIDPGGEPAPGDSSPPR